MWKQAAAWAAVGCGLACGAGAQTYAFTLQNTSSAAWSVSFNAPFQTSGTPASTIIGSFDAATNPGGTRTLPGLFGSDNGLNNAIAITAGGATASGSSGSTPLHPAGTFKLTLHTDSGTCTAWDTSLDLLNGAQITVAANVSITYSSFRTRVPTCTLIGGFPVSIPVGNAVVTGLTAAQQPGGTNGTLTQGANGAWEYSVPMVVDVTPTVTLNGAPTPVDPTPVAIVLTGSVTPAGSTATTTGGTTLSQQQTQQGPTVVDPQAFDDPLCTSHLVANMVLASTTVNLTTNATINASGVAVATPCDLVDFNLDGLFPDAQDITDFLRVFGGGACPTAACSDIDFNNDGLYPDTDDIAAFIRVFAGGPC
ncbi:MAG: hypothetical protein U0637_11645 [Phycisphaerales bacterium]